MLAMVFLWVVRGQCQVSDLAFFIVYKVGSLVSHSVQLESCPLNCGGLFLSPICYSSAEVRHTLLTGFTWVLGI